MAFRRTEENKHKQSLSLSPTALKSIQNSCVGVAVDTRGASGGWCEGVVLDSELSDAI